jgi:ABC-type multidrug transport system fused ATPase/permease subunit
MTAITVTKTATPMRRLLRLARPMRSQLLLAVLAGAVGCGCGVALLAVSGFLLARASQHPNIVAISVAVVMVRALSVGRGLLRYLERLFSHDVAFRVLADVRVAIYRRLERLAPAGLAAFRSGDMLTRLISDVDSTQDLFIRGIAPPLTAALVGAGATAAVLLILAPAADVLAAGLLAAGGLVPLVTVASARRAAQRAAPARGDLGAAVTDLLGGAAELQAFGAVDAGLTRTLAADAELTRLARRSASASGIGVGLSAAASGLTLWGVLILGVAVTGSGVPGPGAAGRDHADRAGRLRGGHRPARGRASARPGPGRGRADHRRARRARRARPGPLPGQPVPAAVQAGAHLHPRCQPAPATPDGCGPSTPWCRRPSGRSARRCWSASTAVTRTRTTRWRT